MNDRQLRNIVDGLGGRTQGVPREDGFDIIDEYGLEPDYLEDLICW